jgi:hypothetical protein
VKTYHPCPERRMFRVNHDGESEWYATWLPLHGEYPLPAGFHAGAAIAAASIAYRHTDDWEAGVAWLERYRQHWQGVPEANGCTLEDFRNGVPQERILKVAEDRKREAT